MKPAICYDIAANKWCIRVDGKPECLTADDLHKKHGISNPIIYCQEWRKEHAKPARDVS